jgi:hypothetical protein
MKGYCSTGQSPQQAVVPMEEEEEVVPAPGVDTIAVLTLLVTGCPYPIR